MTATAQQCRAWHSDRDLFGDVWSACCLLTEGHQGPHIGKDANDHLISWPEPRGDWEQR